VSGLRYDDRLFDSAIDRPPTRDLVKCVSSSPLKHGVDPLLAIKQHEEYIRVLREEGAEVYVMPELCGKPFHPLRDKFTLAAYYVVASRRGDGATAGRVTTMPCLDTAEPYYLSQRRGDPEFKRYLKVVMRYASYIYPDSDSDPVAVLDELVTRYGVLIPSVVYKRARELAAKVQSMLSGRRAKTVAAAVLKIALDEVMVNSNPSNAVFKEVCRKLGVSEQAVNEVVKKIVESRILQ